MLTDWLDNSLRPFAKAQGRSVDEYAAVTGGEGIGVIMEYAADQFAKPTLSTIVQVIASILAGAYATWGKNVSLRTRRELAAISLHEGLRVHRLLHYPFNIEVSRNTMEIASAIQRGDGARLAMALVKSPAELQGMFGAFAPRPQAAPVNANRPGPYTPAPNPETRGNHVVGPAFGITLPPQRKSAYGVMGAGARGVQGPYGAESRTVGRYTVESQIPYGSESQPGLGRYTVSTQAPYG